MSKTTKIVIFTLYMLLTFSITLNILALGNPTDHEISIRLATLSAVNVVVLLTSIAFRKRTNTGAAKHFGSVAGVSDGR